MPQAGTPIRKHQPLERLAWDDIKEPGAYVEIETGTLYRVRRETLAEGASPLVERDGGGSQAVRTEKTPASRALFARVSSDPFIFSLGARMICVDHDIRPQF